MRRFAILLSLLALLCFNSQLFGQGTVTPNIGLEIPAYQQTNWQIPLNYDLSQLDLYLSGNLPLPALSAASIEGVTIVDGVKNATIGSAYNAVPSSGGIVYIPSGTYSVPLGSLVISKPVLFVCENPKTTVINFTGSSGVGFLFNYSTTPSAGDYRDWGSFGVVNCQLLGPGGYGPSSSSSNAGTAIQVGDSTDSAIGAYFSKILVSGFQHSMAWNSSGAPSWGTKCDHCTFLSNTQDIDYTNPEGIENVEFDHSVFATFFNSMPTNDIDVEGGGAANFTFNSCSFDSVQLSLSTGVVNLTNPHFEINTGITTAVPMINQTGGYLLGYGMQLYQDNASGGGVPTTLVEGSAGGVTIDGFYASTAGSIAHEFLFSGSITAYIQGSNRQGAWTGSDVGWSSSQWAHIENVDGSIVNIDSSFDFPNLLISPAQPTISSGFGTSACIGASSSGSTCSGTVNNSTGFQINVGSGGTANTGVIAMNATAQNGWNCTFTDLTTHSNFPQQIPSGSSTTVVEVGGFNSSGAATAWGANDVLNATCVAR